MPAKLVAALLLLVSMACTTVDAQVPRPVGPPVEVGAAVTPVDRSPSGTVTVAYPDEPAALLDVRGDDAAASDLAALWGLPLFRIDPAGQLAAGAVEHWDVVDDDAGWAVEVRLRGGRWSDGRAVGADDLVATLRAVREGPRAAELAPLVDVRAVGERTARLVFDRPYTRWWAVLDGVGVLPAHVLGPLGLPAYAEAVPVSGGWFTVEDRVPGLRTTFRAHGDGPLGAPGVERVEVLVVPRYEAALGMLRDGEVDLVVGYLALNGVQRARRAGAAEAAAPLGGTTVSLRWRPDGPLGGPDAAARRRSIGAAIDVGQLVEGLLGPAGEVATAPVPGVAGAPREPAPGERVPVGEPVLALPRWQEALAFTARAVQRDLRTAGGGASLRAEPSPELVAISRGVADGALVPVRTGPRPSLGPAVADEEVARAADAAGPGTPAFAEALEAAATDGLVWPLYRVGVTHAWSSTLVGVRPSSWLGLAFWDAGAWSVATR